MTNLTPKELQAIKRRLEHCVQWSEPFEFPFGPIARLVEAYEQLRAEIAGRDARTPTVTTDTGINRRATLKVVERPAEDSPEDPETTGGATSTENMADRTDDRKDDA